jgi:hypothetical protein
MSDKNAGIICQRIEGGYFSFNKSLFPDPYKGHAHSVVKFLVESTELNVVVELCEMPVALDIDIYRNIIVMFEQVIVEEHSMGLPRGKFFEGEDFIEFGSFSKIVKACMSIIISKGIEAGLFRPEEMITKRLKITV